MKSGYRKSRKSSYYTNNRETLIDTFMVRRKTPWYIKIGVLVILIFILLVILMKITV